MSEDKLHDELRDHLALLTDNTDLDPTARELAGTWRKLIDKARDEHVRPLSLAFLAGVGCGKSSLIAAASGLCLNKSGEPDKWSVLPVGRGRTTLGETHVCFMKRTDVMLVVDPIPAEDLRTEVQLFARDAWASNQDSSGPSSKAGEELHDLLRAWLAPGAEEKRKALREEVATTSSVDELEEIWLARLAVDLRSKTLRSTFANDQAGYTSLRKTLKDLMKGRLAEAPAPRVTHIYLPLSAQRSHVKSIVDTQGVDDNGSAWLVGRGDILDRVSESDLFVVCSSFENAPDRVSMQLLRLLAVAEAGREEFAGVRLLIVDKQTLDDDASSEDKHDRQIEQQERIEQCRDLLRRADVELPEDSVVALNVCHERERLEQTIREMAEEKREALRLSWRKVLDRAKAATASLRDRDIAKLRGLDLKLWWAWDAELARSQIEPPDALVALAEVFEQATFNEFHWSQLYASTRRRGRYRKLNLIKLGARACADATIAPYKTALNQMSATVEQLAEPGVDNIALHVALRHSQFQVAVFDYEKSVRQAWEEALATRFMSPETRQMWRDCENRWGEGTGFVAYVAQRFREEAERAAVIPPVVQPLIDSLPERPKLFSLNEVRLENFRGIEADSLHFADTTVLIGDNGTGKTSWLEAIATAVGTYLPGVGASKARPIDDNDVRHVFRERAGVLLRDIQVPMAIEVDGIVDGYPLTWSRRVDSLPLDPESRDADGLQLSAKKAGEDVRAGALRQLPLFAYYGTQRLWPTHIEASRSRQPVGNRLDGYRDCLNAASTHEHMLDWIRRYTFAGLQDNKPVVHLRAIQEAVVACIDEAERFYYDVKLEELILIIDGERRAFRTLSDGYRNVVAMVADIAWRAVVLNPDLRERAPELTEGVVLIDEIDLHLHPRWQRRVLADLRRAFPKLQFITTTHSPFIVQSLEDGQLRNLDPQFADAGSYANESPEDISELHMGVQLPQRSQRRQQEYEVATRYFKLLEQLHGADQAETAWLKNQLDTILAPYSDNQAYVAFLELKRGLAEVSTS